MNPARTLLSVLTLLLVAAAAMVPGLGAHARQATPIIGPTAQSQNVQITLLSSVASAAPGSTVTVAIRQVIGEGWHTYWRNPGDSGLPTEIAWTLPAGVSAGAIQWPRPESQPFGPLVNYGYSGTVVLPVEITVPADARPGSLLLLHAAVNWLECADVCIPGDGTVALRLPVSDATRPGPDAATIQSAKALVPHVLGAPGVITRRGGTLVLSVLSPAFAGVTRAQFFPYELGSGALIGHDAIQTVSAGPQGLSLSVAQSPSAPETLDGTIGGVIVTGDGDTAEAFEISFSPGPVPAGVSERTVGVIDPAKGTEGAATADTGASAMPVWQAIPFAFLGGLILNLMPCVFPILAMKALGLVQAAHGDRAEARAHGLLYGAGVMVTFLGLAGLLIGLQAAGIAVGWGFQLQEPLVVLSLVVLLSLIGFNLLGLFEIAGGFQNTGASATSGKAGAFFTGVLAVVVASPCTAPFMGAALGFGLTQPPAVSLAVFAGLGLGFALPFVLVTFVPGLMKRLPRPGPWMVRLKQVLALPVFATAVWLAWVLANQTGAGGWAAAAFAVLAAGLASLALRGSLTRLVRTGLAAGGVALLAGSALALSWQAPGQTRVASSLPDGAEPWSQAGVDAGLADGKTVFVNFTADWCVSCKVNEAGVFSDPAVVAELTAPDTVWLIADWTRRDEAIARALSSHGRSGVPLYLVHKPGAAGAVILPQLPDRAALLAALR